MSHLTRLESIIQLIRRKCDLNSSIALYVALNSTRINCTVDFSKGAYHEVSMGMNVPCPQPKWKVRTNCALLNGVLYYHKKVNTSHSNNIKSFVVVLNSINLL